MWHKGRASALVKGLLWKFFHNKCLCRLCTHHQKQQSKAKQGLAQNLDGPIRANRLILANRFRVNSRTEPSGQLKIANRSFEAIRANRSNVISFLAPYCAIPRDYLSDTPLSRAMVFFANFLVSQHGQLGAISPPPFLSVSPLESMRRGGAIAPPQKGYLSDTCAIPLKTRQNGCDAPLLRCYLERVVRDIGGGISHWAAKNVIRIWGFSANRPDLYCESRAIYGAELRTTRISQRRATRACKGSLPPLVCERSSDAVLVPLRRSSGCLYRTPCGFAYRSRTGGHESLV